MLHAYFQPTNHHAHTHIHTHTCTYTYMHMTHTHTHTHKPIGPQITIKSSIASYLASKRTMDSSIWSSNLKVLWKVSCVGWCFSGANMWRSVFLKQTGERLRQTHEGTFRWSRHRREDALLKQARERTRDGRFFVNDTHVLVRLSLCSWSAFAGLHRRATPLMLDGNHTLKGSEYGSRGKECSALFMNTWSAHPSIGKPFAWVFWSTIRMCVCAQVCVMAKGWC